MSSNKYELTLDFILLLSAVCFNYWAFYYSVGFHEPGYPFLIYSTLR